MGHRNQAVDEWVPVWLKMVGVPGIQERAKNIRDLARELDV